jgi:hypothetical protein
MKRLAALLLVAGSLHWILFFGVPPSVPRERADWPKEFRYYAALRQAVVELRVPYFISLPIQDTRKFLAIPEVVVSPQVLLLRFLSVDAFLVVHFVLLSALGLAGCLALRKRYALSAAPFLLLWLLLSFCGHITSHVAIGHSMWGGVLLLPWFFLFVLELVESNAPRAPVALGIVLLAMLLQGSFHPFVWCVLFLGLLLAFGSAPRLSVFQALAWAAALGLVRLLPAAVVLLGRREQEFQTGFPGLAELLAGLVLVRDVRHPRVGAGSMGGLNWWEFDHYVGVVGLAWILAFGIGWTLARRASPRRRLAGPVAVMAVLTMGAAYAPIVALHVPLLSAERVTSRLFLVPLGMLVVLAAIASEEWLRGGGRGRRLWLWAAVVLTAVLLAHHSHVWSVPQVAELLPPPPHSRDLNLAIVEGTGDGKEAIYLASVRLSALASAVALGVGAWRLRRVREKD